MFTRLKVIRSSKGIGLTIPNMLSLLIMMGIIVMIFIIFITNYFDVTSVINEHSIERKTIDVAQALLSSDKFVYNDGTRYHRAVFDKNKLDDILKKGSSNIKVEFWSPNNRIDIAYPNSIIFVVIRDLEASDSEEGIWYAMIAGPRSSESVPLTTFVECMRDNVKIDLASAFRFRVGLITGFSLWELTDIEKCAGLASASSAEQVHTFLATTSPVTTRGFPVAIKVGDEIHVGRMSVGMIEESIVIQRLPGVS